jgi:hypothetical protein
MTGIQKTLSKQLVVKEIVKCGQDPTYFINNYVKIQHPGRGVIPFKTYPFQDDCIKHFEEHRFNIVLKSRQLGLSTVSAAYAVWLALYQKDKNILVIATKLSTAVNFIKKVKVIVESIPKYLMMCTYDTTMQSVTFSNGSQIKAIPTSPDAGRSEALSLLIVDEAAFIDKFEDVYTGLYPTLSEGGSAIILSTPNGVGGLYHNLWIGAENGANDFNPIKLMWYVHPEHDQKWFDKEARNLSKRKVAQELLCDFLTSGDTFLQQETLDEIRSNIKQPLEKDGPKLQVWIWEKPKSNTKYILSSDVSRGDANDFSTFQIYDYETRNLVCEYMGKIPPDKLADLIIEFGGKYNNALAVVENNTFGYFTNLKLTEAKYPRIYYPKMEEQNLYFDYITQQSDTPGFLTSQKTRQQIITKLEELLRNGTLKVKSQRLYDQLLSFVWVNNKAQANKGSYDDLVITAAIGAWICSKNEGQTQDNVEMIKALLQATSVHSNPSLPIQRSGELVRQLGNQQNTNTYNKAQSYNERIHGSNHNFDWLFK